MSASSLDPELQAAYLERLGLQGEPPSADALQRLHRRHVERIPYETLWIHSDDPWGIDPADSVIRIAQHGRGGYCYHLNGAFAELLQSLGYDVHRHVGGVHGPDGPDLQSVGNHLVLTVRGLPTDANSNGVWYVDAGLGDALHEALPLVKGTYQQGPFLLTLDQTAPDTWHLTHDPKGGFPGMAWTTPDARWTDFAAQHAWLSSSPESGFVRIAMSQCRNAGGVDVVRGLFVICVAKERTKTGPITDRHDWFAALRDLCHFPLDTTRPDTLDRLWERTLASHRAFEESGQEQHSP